MTFRIQTLNNIASAGLERLPRGDYEVASELAEPDAVMVRSADMHSMQLPASLRAVARAGAGVNNIPVDALSDRGIPVFNAPGANANAVKELVLAGMLLAARNIPGALEYVRSLDGTDEEINKAVETGKKRYRGFELPRRHLGVVGLGAIGVEVANASRGLGMNVTGFDPGVTVHRAWQLSADVREAVSMDDLFKRSDVITVHVPLTEKTEHLVNAERLALMPDGSVILNFARGGIVDEKAVLEALDSGKLHAYVTDFPSREAMHHDKVIALPHLGASTTEAEENCAVMVADNLRDFLENGNIRHSVNFPEVVMPRMENAFRLGVANANVPNMVGQVTTCLAEADLNILDLLNRSRGELAYTLVDVDAAIPADTLDRIRNIDGVLAVHTP